MKATYRTELSQYIKHVQLHHSLSQPPSLPYKHTCTNIQRTSASQRRFLLFYTVSFIHRQKTTHTSKANCHPKRMVLFNERMPKGIS